jgi:hypothetical protein
MSVNRGTIRPVPTLASSVAQGDIAEVERFIASGCRPADKDVFAAIGLASTRILEMLLQAGASVEARMQQGSIYHLRRESVINPDHEFSAAKALYLKV